MLVWTPSYRDFLVALPKLSKEEAFFSYFFQQLAMCFALHSA
jgi:hypothetical protein